MPQPQPTKPSLLARLRNAFMRTKREAEKAQANLKKTEKEYVAATKEASAAIKKRAQSAKAYTEARVYTKAEREKYSARAEKLMKMQGYKK